MKKSFLFVDEYGNLVYRDYTSTIEHLFVIKGLFGKTTTKGNFILAWITSDKRYILCDMSDMIGNVK